MSKHDARFTAIFIVIVIAAVVAMATASASAQRTADSDSLPVSLIIENVISAHEQDIRDRMLDYEFNHTTSEVVKANIVKDRDDELNAAALEKQAFLEVLDNNSNRGLIPGNRLDAMLNATKNSIGRIAASSNKLQEKEKKLKGHDASGTVDPVIVNINKASSLADNLTRGNANKGNAGAAPINTPLQKPNKNK